VLGDNAEVAASYDMLRENLETVGVKLDENACQLGRLLQFDPRTEKFLDDEQADQLLTRPYRAPFVVPAEV
jgi:hypothetical protein